MMRLFLAYVDALDTAFDPEIHCDPASSGFAMRFTQDEGGVAQVTIERKQQGWAMMHPDAPRFIILSESPTGDPEDAVVIARGRITSVPGDLFANTQTIEIACSPENLLDVADEIEGTPDGPLLTFAKANAADGPATCFILDDAEDTDPAAYLLGRTQVYHIDPATHEISLSDLSAGPVINMSRAHFHDDSIRPSTEWGEMPVPQVRQLLKFGWQQSVHGAVDIANRVNISGASPYIYTCSPDFPASTMRELPSGLTVENGSGWKTGESMVLSREGESLPFWSGRAARINFDVFMGGDSPNIIVGRIHRELITLKRWRLQLMSLFMHYDMDQQREEEVTIVVDMPLQTVPGLQKIEDMGEFGTVDLLKDPNAKPYEPGEWLAGEIAEFSGSVFECLEDHQSATFHQRKPGQLLWDGQVINLHPYWKKIRSWAPIEATASTVATTEIGREVIAHMVLRGRKRLVERARALKITLTYPWSLARAITLKHSVRCEVQWHDGSVRAIVGKVVSIQKSWSGDVGATIAVTIGVSLGTGTDGETELGHQSTYGSADNYLRLRYLAPAADPDEPELYGVAGDTEYYIDAGTAPRSVDVARLQDPFYAVMAVDRRNEAPDQVSAAMARGAQGLDPRDAIKKNPTKLGVRMRDLAVEGILVREAYVAAEVLSSPRGIDLIEGAEP